MGKPESIFIPIKHCQTVFGFSRATAYRRAKQGAFRLYKQQPEGQITLLKVAEVQKYLESSVDSLGDQMGDQTAKA